MRNLNADQLIGLGLIGLGVVFALLALRAIARIIFFAILRKMYPDNNDNNPTTNPRKESNNG